MATFVAWEYRSWRGLARCRVGPGHTQAVYPRMRAQQPVLVVRWA